MARPEFPDPAPFYKKYIDLIPENDVILALENQKKRLYHLLNNIHSSKLTYAYAPGKWTVAQVLQHCMDAERIFAYRALRIARGDKTPLPGWEENDFAAVANVDHRNLPGLIEEIFTIRKSSTMLLESFSEDCWARTGTANNDPIDVLTISFLIVGHMQHHMEILWERYGIEG
jgi:hypothetical protein